MLFMAIRHLHILNLHVHSVVNLYGRLQPFFPYTAATNISKTPPSLNYDINMVIYGSYMPSLHLQRVDMPLAVHRCLITSVLNLGTQISTLCKNKVVKAIVQLLFIHCQTPLGIWKLSIWDPHTVRGTFQIYRRCVEVCT